jgi:polysaccharide biosynthesis/export protein
MKRLLGLVFITLIAVSSYAQALNLGSLRNLTGAGTSNSQMQMMGMDPGIIGSLLGLSSKTGDGAEMTPEMTGLMQGVLTPEFIQQLLMQRMMFDSAKIVSDITAIQRDSLAQIREGMNIPKANIYGHDFFGSSRLALFERTTDMKAPDDYVLDTNDELNISVWGFSSYNESVRVGPDGHISNKELGRIYVRGMSFGVVKELIRKRVSNFVNLNNSKLEISLNYSRSISVNIVGEVIKPGTYRIPAINSVYNAINAAEGTTAIGSVRNIEVRRGGKTIKQFDLYDFLMNGNMARDFFLQEGDFIYVPTASKVVAIRGSIRRPMQYELLPTENLKELINIAGGLAANAYTQSVQVSRYTGTSKEIQDVNLSKVILGELAFPLKDGDSITIAVIPAAVDNFISIGGAIRYPGNYEFKEGYRVSDLLKLGGGIMFNTLLEKAYIIRSYDDMSRVTMSFSLQNIIIDETSADNILLKKQDSIILFDKSLFREQFSVSIKGSVKKETTMPFTDGLTLNDVLFYAGGFKQEAAGSKIEITRLVQFDKGENGEGSEGISDESQRILVKTIPIADDLSLDNESKGFILFPYDNISVRREFAFDTMRTVTLTGEVRFPGIYTILRKDERMLDLIERAGGLTKYAHPQSGKLFRYDEKIGRVILELTDAFRDPESRANYILKQGDEILIPTVNQVVSIRGAIKYPDLDSLETISGRYIPGKRAKWYIKRYGAGFEKRAKRSSTLSIAPNGEVGSSKFVFFGRRYPKVAEGATITVAAKPPKPPKKTAEKEPINWNILLPAIITTIASTVSTTVLYIMLRR